MMKYYKFSVVVPIYNAEKYLETCISSVVNQNYPEYELILVDDGSSDDSWNIMKKMLSSDPAHIKIFHQENSGQIKARLVGLEHVSGDYCLFLDADDYYEPYAFNEINKALNVRTVDMLIFNANRVWDDHKELFWPEYKNEIWYGGTEAVQKVKNDTISTRRFNNICLKAFRKELLNAFKQNDESSYFIRIEEDLLMQLPFMDVMTSVMYIPEELYCYRYNQNGISNCYNSISINAECFVSQRLKLYANKWGLNAYEAKCNSRFLKDVVSELKRYWKYNHPQFNKMVGMLQEISGNQYFRESFSSKIYKLSFRCRLVLKCIYNNNYRIAYSLIALKNDKMNKRVMDMKKI